MREITSDNFGLLIAYLVPGFTVLLGVSYFSETAAAWLRGASGKGPQAAARGGPRSPGTGLGVLPSSGSSCGRGGLDHLERERV